MVEYDCRFTDRQLTLSLGHGIRSDDNAPNLTRDKSCINEHILVPRSRIFEALRAWMRSSGLCYVESCWITRTFVAQTQISRQRTINSARNLDPDRNPDFIPKGMLKTKAS
ncbi:hypothetical protein P879_00024 [Paragonimus westermani]|uniref:Uncharacterized protein n=1 Tax=Paragonimus westermani TaxID=34504 RepID=A0A8T0DXX5_9TREM|nr:hypothetical protein P879_00024 [Paragonimus westermani]